MFIVIYLTGLLVYIICMIIVFVYILLIFIVCEEQSIESCLISDQTFRLTLKETMKKVRSLVTINMLVKMAKQ